MSSILGQLIKHRRIIKLVAVGNEPFLPPNRAEAMPNILQAFKNVVKLVADNGLSNEIKVTIPFSAVALDHTYPVADSVFHAEIIDLMRTITPILIATKSKFSINLYPYFDYVSNPVDIALSFALGPMLDTKLQGCRLALNKIGAQALPIIVGETGWPTAGGKDTTIANTKIYLENVIRYARSTNLAETIYFYTAFDESWKLGNGADPVEGNFGIHYQNLTPKFQFDISSYIVKPTTSSTTTTTTTTSTKPTTTKGGSVPWTNNDWALNCDFHNNDIGSVQVAAPYCGPKCQQTHLCTHYTWNLYNGGTCWMKSGAVKRSDAFYVAQSDFVCGINPILWRDNLEAYACSFYGMDTSTISVVQLQRSDCPPRCFSTSGCTHYTWTPPSGAFGAGPCTLMSGPATVSNAFTTGDEVALCGLRGVNWYGNNWAFNCNFETPTFASTIVRGDQCSNSCVATAGCTHYSWAPLNDGSNNGTCAMKKGLITKANAYFIFYNNGAVCGLL